MSTLLKALQHPAEAAQKTALWLTGCGWRGLRGSSSPPSRPPRPLPTARAPSSAAKPTVNGLVRFPPGTAEPNTSSRDRSSIAISRYNPHGLMRGFSFDSREVNSVTARMRPSLEAGTRIDVWGAGDPKASLE